jgi:5-methylcytosine-specific restriction endonuclease McrA
MLKRKNGYRFLATIIDSMNTVCPLCKNDLDIQGVRKYIEYMQYRKTGGIPRVKRNNIDVTIDHILPIWKGGTNEMKNLQLMHSRCNSLKGGREPRLLKLCITNPKIKSI